MESPPLEGERIEERKEGTNGIEYTGRTERRTNIERFIPLDIIMSILSRVRGSSLVRFRLVCKLWNSLTYDPYFINLHLEHATRVDPPRIILFSRVIEQSEKRFHLTLLDETWRPKYKLTRPSPIDFATPPCNGLICLYGVDRSITLCNPTTQEFLNLPKPPTPYSQDTRIVLHECCFGFHHVTKEYKVVLFSLRWLKCSIKKRYDQICEVFTLGTNSWRSIVTSMVDCDLNGPGINVHGSIFWTKFNSYQVIEFDLKDERFRSIPPPYYLKWKLEGFAADISLFQSEGNLFLVKLPDGSPAPMEIWMLKDYTNSLWIHRWRIPLHSRSIEYFWMQEPIIIYGERILLRSDTSLWYHPLQSQRETVEMVYRDEKLGYSARVYAFVESLVSLRNQGKSNG